MAQTLIWISGSCIFNNSFKCLCLSKGLLFLLYLDSSPLKSLGAQHLSVPFPFAIIGYGSIVPCGSVPLTAGGVFGIVVLTVFSGSIGVIPNLDKFIGVNVDVRMIGPSSGCMLLLGVLVIAGDPLGVVRLLKGDTDGPGPVIHLYLPVVDTGVDVSVTGICDAGGLLPSSALSYCSSPDVKVLSDLGRGSIRDTNCPVWSTYILGIYPLPMAIMVHSIYPLSMTIMAPPTQLKHYSGHSGVF
ncbi:uncharacterized protein LACBIDRAFT_331084 [Laccaria bicolor S238N-H82]|uniref:Predicted protein n=1 Tax=Laccaria bicolor (strain S238N-H82 / ATCC MYA-4686) TaxID=486041 RepID=B0DNE9_LACBS|nr:uncharacterized protein LACBIDRAFT_331084 [Laccaria bicolor S238N-H82]EDR03859.1 predicted protein [Laccaria bicolor S238N-H82]|eukprot:XP_001885427.1 predicted protein [Laccaria bicolor S238N-H82]